MEEAKRQATLAAHVLSGLLLVREERRACATTEGLRESVYSRACEKHTA